MSESRFDQPGARIVSGADVLVQVGTDEGQVVLDFGEPIGCAFRISPAAALALAEILRVNAAKARRAD